MQEALHVSITLVRCLNTLHSACMVNGNLTEKRILVQEKSNVSIEVLHLYTSFYSKVCNRFLTQVNLESWNQY